MSIFIFKLRKRAKLDLSKILIDSNILDILCQSAFSNLEEKMRKMRSFKANTHITQCSPLSNKKRHTRNRPKRQIKNPPH